MKKLRGLLFLPGMAWGLLLGAEPDVAPPTVVTTNPAPNAVVAALAQIEVAFSKPVAGVDAADLRINAVAATNVFAAAPGQYVFEFPQPLDGVITVTWVEDHGITDLAVPPNAFAGGSWTIVLDTRPPLTGVILNEFMAANNAGLRDEDGDTPDWIELRNTNRVAVDLEGWFLTDEAAYLTKWRFPSVTLETNIWLCWLRGRTVRPTSTGCTRASNLRRAGSSSLW
jgi:hypothetical protein